MTTLNVGRTCPAVVGSICNIDGAIRTALYWMILLGIFVALLDALGVQAAGGLFVRMINYLPNLVLAIGILVFGSLLARFLGGVVYTYLNNIGSTAAEPISAVTRFGVLAAVKSTNARPVTGTSDDPSVAETPLSLARPRSTACAKKPSSHAAISGTRWVYR